MTHSDKDKTRPWIQTVSEEEATGRVAQHYQAARERAGKVFQIIKIMSLRPAQLDASMAVYRAVMFGSSGLSRAEREMVATIVSSVNHCHY